jgi:ParB-like chromosome segregation protein Spo0J
MSTVKMAVSLKALAESKTDGVSKTTQFKVDPMLLEIEDGFNARPIDLDHVAAMKESFLAGAVFPPLQVRVESGRIVVVDGHHRRAMFLQLVGEGHEIVGVDAVQFRGNDADRVAMLLTSAQGKPLTPLQQGVQYRRLIGFGWDKKAISAKVGRSMAFVNEALLLAESNSDVQEMVASKAVSAKAAIRAVREHGEKAGAAMKQAMNSDGKIPRRISLDAAIQMEIDTVGVKRAEDSAPHFAGLISYMRSAA